MKKFAIVAFMLSLLLALSACAETIKVGSSIDFPPYEYYDDETGDIVGIEIDIIHKIGEALGMDVEVQDMQFDSIIAAVVSGKVDVGVSGFTVTEERKQNVDFTTTYTTAKQSVIVTNDSPIQSVDDILNPENSWKIGVQIGTTSDLYITDDIDALGLPSTVERFNKSPDTVVALNSGKVDCVIVDDQVAIHFVQANEGLKLLDTAYVLEDYAFCFPKESPLYEDFNAALEALMADGTVQSIIDQYIVAE
ncbi:MAG: transporter substrate-binding domain-containing protein [Clostridia bacterium]|nr:transporter substrate-binding domain-containing protein [Clostridia bacterium]